MFWSFPSCCIPKFSLSFHKGSTWTLRFATIQFQAMNYKFSKKAIHKGKMVSCPLKSLTLTFGSKSIFKNHSSSILVEVWSLFHQEIQKSKLLWRSQNSKYLEFFSKCLRKYDKLKTSDQIITMMQADSGRTSNTRVVYFNKIWNIAEQNFSWKCWNFKL